MLLGDCVVNTINGYNVVLNLGEIVIINADDFVIVDNRFVVFLKNNKSVGMFHATDVKYIYKN